MRSLFQIVDTGTGKRLLYICLILYYLITCQYTFDLVRFHMHAYKLFEFHQMKKYCVLFMKTNTDTLGSRLVIAGIQDLWIYV